MNRPSCSSSCNYPLVSLWHSPNIPHNYNFWHSVTITSPGLTYQSRQIKPWQLKQSFNPANVLDVLSHPKERAHGAVTLSYYSDVVDLQIIQLVEEIWQHIFRNVIYLVTSICMIESYLPEYPGSDLLHTWSELLIGKGSFLSWWEKPKHNN